jgi:hypothetical protein
MEVKVTVMTAMDNEDRLWHLPAASPLSVFTNGNREINTNPGSAQKLS